MARLRRGQIFVRQHLGIERVVVAEVLLLESLAVNLVFLRELVALRRVEGVELAHGLRGERLAVHEKQDAPGELAFEQAIDLRDGQVGLARAGGHRDHHVVLAAEDRLLDG